MDDTYKLKMKIGDHQFEAEGPVEVVQSQFAAFKEMISGIGSVSKVAEPTSENQSDPAANGKLPHLPLEKILKADGRVISLTANCETIEDAVLLILLGQKDFRTNQEVTGSEIMDGLTQSGYRLERVDRIMDKLSLDASVITVGVRRGRRYRLSNSGLTKALNIAKAVISTVP